MAEFDEQGQLTRHTIDIPLDATGPIIRISYLEYRRQVKLHDLRRTPNGTPQERKQKRDAEYRESIRNMRPPREKKKVDESTRTQVWCMLDSGVSGREISIATGVSTTYVSRQRKLWKQERGQ